MKRIKVTIRDPLRRVTSRFELEEIFFNKILTYKEKFELRKNYLRFVQLIDITQIPTYGWCPETYQVTINMESSSPESLKEFIYLPLQTKLYEGLKNEGFEIHIDMT